MPTWYLNVWLFTGSGVAFTAQFTVGALRLFDDHWSITCIVLLPKVFALLFSVLEYVRHLCDKTHCSSSCDWKNKGKVEIAILDCKSNENMEYFRIKELHPKCFKVQEVKCPRWNCCSFLTHCKYKLLAFWTYFHWK